MRTGVLALAVLLIACIVAAVALIRKPPPMPKTAFTLTSPAFEDGGTIPAKYTCDGDRKLSPALAWSGAPEGTKAFALIVDDPDIPSVVRESRGIDAFDHWVLFNIPAELSEIPEDDGVGTAGLNSAGTGGYTGPCPPTEYEPHEHRYIFTLYALGSPLALPAGATKKEVLDALRPVVLGEAELVGRYSRK